PHEPLPAGSADDEIELEPTVPYVSALPSSSSQSFHMALATTSMPSLTTEVDELKRKRLLAASVFLAATFALLCSWVFASENPGTLTVDGSRYSLRVGLIALRCILSASVAGLLASEVPLTRRQLRVVEYVLFLGLTLLISTSQYFVGLDLMRRG